MGVISGIIKQIGAVAKDIAIAGAGILTRIGTNVAKVLRSRLQASLQEARDTWNDRRKRREGVTDELRDINDELAWLDKRRRASGLNSTEHTRSEDLKHKREELKTSLQEVDEERIAEGISAHETEYDAVTITDANTHLLQSTVGQTLYGKKCPKCGWQMQLQWSRQINLVGTHDFGWGCTGWYWHKREAISSLCNHWESLVPEDFDIFARAKRQEFTDLSPQQFNDMVLNYGHAEMVESRIEEVLRDSASRANVDAYRCPVHAEPLVLRKKKNHSGSLLDMYFLGCPRWRSANEGCQYLVKLKSAAQLHSYLEAATGDGVL